MIHSCSYYCERPECIKAQRDELRSRLAQPEQEPVAHTTGHCENHKQKGGCQLHNLQCGWPDCDRKPITAQPQPEQPNDFNPDWDAMAVMVEEQQRMAKRIAELEAQPEQEPVAWIDEFGNVFPLGAQRGPKHLNEPMKPLYTAPPPCPTCEALARTVMLDQTSHDTHHKPLTDEQIEPMFRAREKLESAGEKDAWYWYAWGVSDGEAAHGIKENT